MAEGFSYDGDRGASKEAVFIEWANYIVSLFLREG